MEKSHRILGLLLAAQLVLAAGLLAWQVRKPGSAEPQALFAFDAQAVDRLVIEGPDQARVELLRQGSDKDAAWAVAQAGNFPADAARVRQIIDRLHDIKAGDPVATTAAAAERFNVADAGFERRVAAEAGGKALATLLLGNSQGARQTYARKAGESAVLSVDWPAYELPLRADDWLDKSALRVPQADIEAIEVDGLRLARAEAPPAGAGAGSDAASAASAAAGADPAASAPAAVAAVWQASGLPEGQQLDAAAADRLAQAIAELSFTGLRGHDESARQGLGEPERLWRVQRRDGQAIDYRLYKLAGSEDRALVVSSRGETFTLAAHEALPLLNATRRAVLLGAPAAGGG